MVKWLRKMLRLDAEEALHRREDDEQILYVIGRHWVVLVGRLIVPVLAILIFSGLALYRSAGGGFLVTETGEPTGLDFVNWLLIGVIGVLVLLWASLWVRRSKDRRARNVLLGVGGALLLLIYFRSGGGRVFYIDRMMFADQGTDFINIVLIGLALLSGMFTLFGFYDWLNDELILTNRRVVYDNDQVYIPRLLEQRVQQQIYLQDIQDVNSNTKTYTQHWLGYGSVEVKSARIGGNIVFASAHDAKEMGRQIMNQVKALRKEHSARDFDRMIEDQVYGNKPAKQKQTFSLKRTQLAGPFRWVLVENPDINEDTSTIIWRPHWLFQLQALGLPLAGLLAGLLVVALLARLLELDPLTVTLSTAAVVLVFSAWAAWEIEDYRNDQYILSPTNIIDIEKKPFGPEDRRQASLGAITNVTYKTTFVSNLLGYGDVILETAGSGGRFTFSHVPDPSDVVDTVNDYFVAFKRGEKEKNLADTVALISTFHKAQQRHNELNAPL